MTHLQITLVIFAVLFVPGALACLTVLAGEAIAARIQRRRA